MGTNTQRLLQPELNHARRWGKALESTLSNHTKPRQKTYISLTSSILQPEHKTWHYMCYLGISQS